MFTPLPQDTNVIQKQNFRNVQIDAIGVALSSAAAPFLPVFLARLGASNFQIGLLTAMPGVTGLILAIVIGRFLQTRRNIVPWFSGSRLLVLSSFALTGLAAIFIPARYLVNSVLGIWALATIPQTTLAVCFSVVMNAIAGPDGRYALLSRRWTIFGLTNAIVTFGVTQLLDRIRYPLNYQLMFIGLSIGGLISFYFSSRINLPDQTPPPLATGHSLRETARNYLQLLRSHPAFAAFVSKRFVYLSAIALSAPIFPLYFVRVVGASDAEIGTINMTMSAVMMVGYSFWSWVSRKKSSRLVLLMTAFGLMLYPLASALTPQARLIMLYAGTAGFFQAGLDLVFFDELMKTVPAEYSATFVSLAQSLQYLSSVFSPLLGTFLADHISLGGALFASAGLRLLGFLLFLRPERKPAAA